jgi:hypothetical protein
VPTLFRSFGLCAHLALNFAKIFLITAIELRSRY